MVERIQRLRTKGWRMSEGARYVGRPSRWGNPFVVGSYVSITGIDADGLKFDCFEIALTAENVVDAYRDLMTIRMLDPAPNEHPEDVARWQEWKDELAALRGHDLVCWCPLDQPCHADVLLRLANRRG